MGNSNCRLQRTTSGIKGQKTKMDQIYNDIIGTDLVKKMRQAGLFKAKYVANAVNRVMDRAYTLGSNSEQYIAEHSFSSKDDLDGLCGKEDLEAGLLSTKRKVNILCKACERVYLFGLYMSSHNFNIMQ